MISIAIVDDDYESLNDLKQLLYRYEKDQNEVVKIYEFDSAAKLIFSYEPIYDVIFLDIEMSDLNGLEAAHLLRKEDKHVFIIFVTKMAQYALEGYKVDALDYFVKPANYYDVKMRLDRIRRLKTTKEESFIKFDSGVKEVNIDDIYYVEVCNHTITYHMKDEVFEGKRKSMREIARRLVVFGFSLCHVSYLVNLKYCRIIDDNFVQSGDDILPLSRSRAKEFKTKLQNRYIGYVK